MTRWHWLALPKGSILAEIFTGLGTEKHCLSWPNTARVWCYTILIVVIAITAQIRVLQVYGFLDVLK